MHPILFKIGPITIYTYGVLITAGFLLGLALAVRQAKKEGIEQARIVDLGLYIIISAIIGSRLLYIITHYEYYIKKPLQILKVWEGGLVLYGGLFLAIAVGLLYLKKAKLPAWKVADIIAPSIAIGLTIGRWGCFSAGCCYGRETDLPWGVVFTDPYSLARLGVPLHPTQLYESLGSFLIFLVLVIKRRKKTFEGQLFLLFLLLYSILRFVIEFFRADEARDILYNGISIAQGISIIIAVASMVILINRKKQKQERMT
ncbi:MAG: prolipoprotein diacylglyceryl transferase [Nitrospirota bacterium]